MRIHYLIIPALAGALLFVSSCSRQIEQSAPHVLILTVDTLRADRTGFCGSPASSKTPDIDALAQQGVRFSRAYSVVPLTLPSHASMMTGLHPIQLGVHNNGPVKVPETAYTLAECLRTNGYQTCAAVSASVLYPDTGISQGFDRYDASFSSKRTSESASVKTYLLAERNAEKTIAAAMDMLKNADSEKSLFLWVHLYDPHDPFEPPPGFTKPGELPYDGEVRYADHWAGALFNAWDEFCGEHSNLVVVASDHGEGLGDNGEEYHGLFLYDSTLHVPLAVRGTGIAPAANTDQACLYDIYPTVLSYCIASHEYDGPGIDLLSASKREIPLVAETLYPESLGIRVSRGYSARTGSNKIILQPDTWLLTSSDTAAESGVSPDSAVVDQLKETIENTVGLFARNSLAPDSDNRMLSRTLDAIVSLGYVGGGAVTVSPDAPLFPHPDWAAPMSVTGYISKFEAVRRTPDVRRRLQLLQSLYTADPKAEYVKGHLGEAFAAIGRIPQAMQFFDRIAISNACNAPLLHTMTLVYIKSKNIKKAVECAEQAIRVKPDKSSSYDAMAAALGAAGQFKRAREFAGKAIKIEPGNHLAWNTAGYIEYRLQNTTSASNMFHTAIVLSGTNDLEALNNYAAVCKNIGADQQAEWAELQVQKITLSKKKRR